MHMYAHWDKAKTHIIKFSLIFEVKTKNQKQLTEYLPKKWILAAHSIMLILNWSGFDQNGKKVDLQNQTEPGSLYGFNFKLFTGGNENELRNYLNNQLNYGLMVSIDEQDNIPLTSLKSILSKFNRF
jgi:hypothetical protein